MNDALASTLSFGATFFMILGALWVYFAFCLTRLASKTRTPGGWMAWVPIFNVYLMTQIGGRPGWWVALAFIPVVNLMFVLILWSDIAEAAGHHWWLGLLVLVPVLGILVPPYLAFAEGVAGRPVAAEPTGPTIPCPSCGGPTMREDAFCGDCGGALHSRPVARPSARPEPAAGAIEDDPTSRVDVHGTRPAAGGATPPTRVVSPPVSAGPDATVGYGSTAPVGHAVLVHIGKNGAEIERYTMDQAKLTIGRELGDLRFPTDVFLSNPHADLCFAAGELTVVDRGSRNGVFRRLLSPTVIVPGDVILVGEHALELTEPEAGVGGAPDGAGAVNRTAVMTPGSARSMGWLVVTAGDGNEGNRYALEGDESIIGRSQGDIVFTRDSFVSERHARIHLHENDVVVEDLNSRNGTYVRVRESFTLAHGDWVKLGKQRFRVEIG